jgi:hypothetical protein
MNSSGNVHVSFRQHWSTNGSKIESKCISIVVVAKRNDQKYYCCSQYTLIVLLFQSQLPRMSCVGKNNITLFFVEQSTKPMHLLANLTRPWLVTCCCQPTNCHIFVRPWDWNQLGKQSMAFLYLHSALVCVKGSYHVVKHIIWASRKLKEVFHLDSWKNLIIKLYLCYQNWESKNMCMGLSNAIDMIES